MAGKQAKILNEDQLRLVLNHVSKRRYPKRDRVIVLLSHKAGLRAQEIALLRRYMIMDSSGQVGDTINVEDGISKKGCGRIVPIAPILRVALIEYLNESHALPEDPVLISERSCRDNNNAPVAMRPNTIVNFFGTLYKECKLIGCSSHSGRRTFITRGARGIGKLGGSLRDIQQMAGHSSLQTTQSYIEGDEDAKRKLVGIL